MVNASRSKEQQVLDTGALKRFAQAARRELLAQVEVRLDKVLKVDSTETREREEAIRKLKEEIEASSKKEVVERVAYTWFNRFCALRYMDVNRFSMMGIVSPAEGATQPEILQEAKGGYIDQSVVPNPVEKRVQDILSGQLTSTDPQQEAYRLLLVAACNYYNKFMPFMFQTIADYTELLMPEDLLSESSVLYQIREALTPETCRNVEVIGWLYQFYISEKKEEVDKKLKKNGKVEVSELPAKTALYTPHWIVRYLVENSLGRLWMLNHPDSKLVERMDYYIAPEQPETDFIRIKSPEEFKVCDPACGSGHMLTYAFDLLYDIYEEQGYDAPEIPRLILENNLFGLEIDERSGELAAFALCMKGMERHKRFLQQQVEPQICVLKNIAFEPASLKAYMDAVGRNLFTSELQSLLHQFEEAQNYGSLIRPVVTDVVALQQTLAENNVSGNVLFYQTHEKVRKVLRYAEFLSPKYHVVVANPPYLGKGMNPRLSGFVKDSYPETKSDLFAVFIERNLELAGKYGMVAMVTMQSWMFLSTYEKFRETILNKNTIFSMAHLGARAFDSIGGEVVSTTAFVIQNSLHSGFKGSFMRLVGGRSESEKEAALLESKEKRTNFYLASAEDFKKIPGWPIAYWSSQAVLHAFETFPKIKNICEPKSGLSTTDNNRFLRFWHEVDFKRIPFDVTDISETEHNNARWYPFSKGGDYRKWSGNCDYVVNWWRNGSEIREATKGAAGGRIVSPEFYFKPGITWSGIASGKPSMRMINNSIFGSGGKGLFTSEEDSYFLGFLNSQIALYCLEIISPTLNYEAGHIGNLPILRSEQAKSGVELLVSRMVILSQIDWDSYETSWDFTTSPLLPAKLHSQKLHISYTELWKNWQTIIFEMQNLEEKNNTIFIELYGLPKELTPEIPLKEITLTCNPAYRYKKSNKKKKAEADDSEDFTLEAETEEACYSTEEQEAFLLADTMKEFLSYAVGCMLGRYSLDKPGLILANQGETLEDYLKQVPKPTFEPDQDNVIPILEGNWFTDDIVDRFQKFLRVTFGDEHYTENLAFIEKGIGQDLRKFFVKDFYEYHVKMYKKRPIYWLFSSPKGSFKALIYMHRYRPDTVSTILNEYLRELRNNKLPFHMNQLKNTANSASASQTEKTKALKDIEATKKMMDDLNEYENEILYPLATQQIEMDLDDGVLVNYKKFGKALAPVKGLSD